MKSQQHRWKTWLSQVVRHQGGASTVEWIGLLAIVLVALGVSAFALTQNGNVIGESFARQFGCALRVIGIEGVTCDQLDEAEARGIDVSQQTIDPPPSLPTEEGYECQQGESTIGDDGYLQQTTSCSRVAPDNPKAVETCTATATGQDLWEGEAPPPEYSCETTQIVPEPLEGYECTETTSTTADGDQQFDQDCWRVSPDDPGSVEECHNSTVVNAQSLANDTSWNCETQRVAPEPLPAEEGWECNDSTDGNQLTQTCEKREENGDETTITTCTNTTVVQPGGESSGWDCESVVEREEEECKLEWKFWKTIENCTREYIIEPIAEHVIEPFLGAMEDVWEGAKAFLTGEFQALIGIIEGIIEFFKNPSLDALLKILDSACGSMVLQFIPGVGDALGALCDAKELIESSIDGDIAGIVISALSLAIEALFAFVPGMGDFVGELMDQLTPTIRKLFKSGDEAADTGTDVARQGDDVVDAAAETPDSDACIIYRGKVRGLAAPKRCAPGTTGSAKKPKTNLDDQDVKRKWKSDANGNIYYETQGKRVYIDPDDQEYAKHMKHQESQYKPKNDKTAMQSPQPHTINGTVYQGQVKYNNLKSDGKSGEVSGTITPGMAGKHTTNPDSTVLPTGWDDAQGVKGSDSVARLHLFGAQLGGSNKNPQNFVTGFQSPNLAMKSEVEDQVAKHVKAGNAVDYKVKPHYSTPGQEYPDSIQISVKSQTDPNFEIHVLIKNTPGNKEVIYLKQPKGINPQQRSHQTSYNWVPGTNSNTPSGMQPLL